jgi:DEAD/DEAH box helicase domain-containing protein
MPFEPTNTEPVCGRKRKRCSRAADARGIGNSNGSNLPLTPKKLDNSPPPTLNPTTLARHVPTDEWPDAIKEVENIHRALNIVFTFCSTRKHVLTTFDNIKRAVEHHIGRPLTVEDVASVVAIRPEAIKFTYTTKSALLDDIKGHEKDLVLKTALPKSATSQGPAVDDLIGNSSFDGPNTLSHCYEDDNVLYFEFMDGDVKPELYTAAGSDTGRAQSSKNKAFKMPVYSPERLSSLIHRRNQKFHDCLGSFVDGCVRTYHDPSVSLRNIMKAYIPLPLAQDRAAIVSDAIHGIRHDMSTIVDELKYSPWYSGQIVPGGHRVLEPRRAVYGELNFHLSQDLVNALFNSRGIVRFYSHQAEALNHLSSGHNVVVSTSTSSGKSLIYQVPILQALEANISTRAIYIFPTKALAQDQKRSLNEILHYMPRFKDVLATFDGDTPKSERESIRENARIFFTNPDMLHLAILPQEERWRKIFQYLKFVVGR